MSYSNNIIANIKQHDKSRTADLVKTAANHDLHVHSGFLLGKDGKPLVVWYGMKNPVLYVRDQRIVTAPPPFATFSRRFKTDPGIWFSPRRSWAAKYGEPVAFFLRISHPIRHEGPLLSIPEGCDGVYRMHGKGDDICEAMEIAVFDPHKATFAESLDEAVPLEVALLSYSKA